MPDIFESLTSDHRMVEQLFASYASDRDDATAHEICQALILHSEVEDQVLYPEVRRIVDGGDDAANQAEDEHGAVRSLIARVFETPPSDLTELMEEIRMLVEHHVQSEEAELFPRLREAGADVGALGRKADTARSEASSRSSGQAG